MLNNNEERNDLKAEEQNGKILNLVASISEKSKEIKCRMDSVNDRMAEEERNQVKQIKQKSQEMELKRIEVKNQSEITYKYEELFIRRDDQIIKEQQQSRNPINLLVNFIASLKFKELLKRFFTFIQSAMGVINI